MYLRTAGVAVAALVVGASPAAADPDNSHTLHRTLACDNGLTVETVFAGENGSNFNVTTDESVFVYTTLIVDRPPLGEGGDDTVDIRGMQGLERQALVTCQYTTPSGNHVTVIGFFTPRNG